MIAHITAHDVPTVLTIGLIIGILLLMLIAWRFGRE
jgi:hypothetical protein